MEAYKKNGEGEKRKNLKGIHIPEGVQRVRDE